MRRAYTCRPVWACRICTFGTRRNIVQYVGVSAPRSSNGGRGSDQLFLIQVSGEVGGGWP